MTLIVNDADIAYSEGYDSVYADTSLVNPYHPETELFDAWEQGAEDAQMDLEDQDALK